MQRSMWQAGALTAICTFALTVAVPQPTPWPKVFHAYMLKHRDGQVGHTDLFYDWPGGGNLHIDRISGQPPFFDNERQNGSTYYYTPGGSCKAQLCGVWLCTGSFAGFSLGPSATVEALHLANHSCGELTSEGFAQGDCMSHRDSAGASDFRVDEIESLREELRRLSIRVEEQETELARLRGASAEATEAGSEEAPSPAAADTDLPDITPRPGSWSYREEVARQVGAFLRRSLNGEHRGASGRGLLPNLQNRIYIVVRDYQGTVYDPVRIENRFHRVRALCQDYTSELMEVLALKDSSFQPHHLQFWTDNVIKKASPVEDSFQAVDDQLVQLDKDARASAFRQDTLKLTRDCAQLAQLYKAEANHERSMRIQKVSHLKAQNLAGATYIKKFMSKNARHVAGRTGELEAAADEARNHTLHSGS
eukprot:Skav214225  [mRNA]  locus=scaffold856:87145:101073:+ [translate_table: standard]